MSKKELRLCFALELRKEEGNKSETCNFLLCEENLVYVLRQAYKSDKTKISINLNNLSKYFKTFKINRNTII